MPRLSSVKHSSLTWNWLDDDSGEGDSSGEGDGDG